MNTVHQLPFKTQFRAAATNTKVTQHDKARSQHMLAGANPHGPLALMQMRHKHKPSHLHPADSCQVVGVVNAGVTYLASVTVGSPGTPYDLLIDTGSSNTWINCTEKPFKPTDTTTDTRKPFQISYGRGDCKGTEYLDQVSLGPGLIIKDQSIGVADQANDMNGMGGILGVGPTCLTLGTTADHEGIPTVMDNLVKQGTISQECLSVSYAPTTGENELSGTLCIGGVDKTQYTGDLTYVPLTKQQPACNYWGIEQSITYDGVELMPNCAGISDTGTTLIMLPTESFKKYQAATGAQMDETTGLLTVTDEQYDCMKSMFFNIGGVQYEFTKNAQLWPRCINTMLGGDEGKKYLVFADMGDVKVGDGLCFINGYALLQRFYSVYDTTNCRLGMATTEHTMAETN
ncbi:Peptidase A1 domain-containing protein [Mycena kentingensis (nom. inval.)]|nr:Peptidase A1 domain-containing protein [Mycena kentingensis (nom. inval.)]